MNKHPRLARVIPLEVTLSLLTAGVATEVGAEPTRYTPDKWHTRILFSLDHMGLSNYAGRFRDFEIDFLFDAEDMSASSVAVTIPVSSIDTFSPELNGRMPSFFDTENHPNIVFESTEVEATGANTARMTGDLTIKGVTLPMVFYVTHNGTVLHPRFDLNNAGFTATGKVDSRAFGVNQLPVWMLGSMVDVTIQLEAFEGDRVPYYADDDPDREE